MKRFKMPVLGGVTISVSVIHTQLARNEQDRCFDVFDVFGSTKGRSTPSLALCSLSLSLSLSHFYNCGWSPNPVGNQCNSSISQPISSYGSKYDVSPSPCPMLHAHVSALYLASPLVVIHRRCCMGSRLRPTSHDTLLAGTRSSPGQGDFLVVRCIGTRHIPYALIKSSFQMVSLAF